MIRLCAAAGYLIAFLACGGLPAVDARAEGVRIGTPWLELEADRDTGAILALIDQASKQNFASAGTNGLWELELGGTPARVLSPADAQSCEVTRLNAADPGLRLAWSQFGLADAPGLRVEVTVLLETQRALSRWQLAVKSPGPRAIGKIRFPRLLDLPQMERERLAVPFWAGLLSSDPRGIFASSVPAGGRRDYDYPGLGSMQFLAFYSEGGPGLYLAADDTASYRKLFAVFSRPSVVSTNGAPIAGAENGTKTCPLPDLNVEIVHLPERPSAPAKDYVLPYSAVVGTFRGDWFGAARIYRAWATNQVWALESRWKRGGVPSWIRDTGLWVWNRGRSPDVVGPAIEMQRELGLPVSLFWHWWHGCAYDVGFPEYLPPREGEASFAGALRRAHARDVRALVYMNQRLWGMTTASWTNENAAAYAVKAADGQVKPEVYNTFTKLPCASMCLGTAFWRAKYSGLAAEAFHRLGVDGIYMDQACSSLACFDPEHGHPPGGGAYWMAGFKALTATIRQECASRGGVALAGEGCAENWLPYLDLMLALDVSRERYCAPDGWDPIPLFQSVYHGYGAFFGSYSSLTSPPYDEFWPAEHAPKKPLDLLDRQFARQFFLEQARSFVWGQQATLANYRPSQRHDRALEIQYVIRLAKLRQKALQYLQDGAMLPPPMIEAPSEEAPISRLSIYAGQQDTVNVFKKTVPLVLGSGWRAPDGNVALIMASVADRPVTATVRVDRIEWGLPALGKFVSAGNDATGVTASIDGRNLKIRIELNPLEARIIPWEPATGSQRE